MEYKHFQDLRQSSGTNQLVEKVRNSNINCDSPFRLLPNISTPPSRIFGIRNPFESPLIDRLHLPVCSPGLFAKSTPKRDEKFVWSICDISHLKPADIDTNCYQESTLDPQTESVIQDKISSFFKHHAVVPSPGPRDAYEKKNLMSNDDEKKAASLSINKMCTESTSAVAQSISYSEMDIENISDEKPQYLPDDVYYKKLFEFESETPDRSPSVSPLESPVQFSPLQTLEVKSCSDEMDKKSFQDCILSPINSENETSRRENSKNMSTQSIRESKPVCRLVFPEKIAHEGDNTDGANDFELYREPSLENTVTEFIDNDSSDENLGIMSIDEIHQECEVEQMEISLTPKTGLFGSPRKKLSDSFNDFHSSFNQEEICEYNTNNIVAKSGFLPEGSSDLGYYSANTLTGPSMTENTWNSSHVFASTPTKRKNL